MDVKQSKVATFFIDNKDEETTLAYIEKNAPLLKSHLLLFSQPLSDALQARCLEWKLTATYNRAGLKNKHKSSEVKSSTESSKVEKSVESKEIFRSIRSGESLSHNGDLLISGNINDGASVSSEGNMTIFGIIRGDIKCQGNYLILSSCHSGRVVFQNDVINENIHGEALKIFYKENSELKVKELH
jgi:septum site-determining protein MinC